jgi:hypothetical protein
MVESIMLQTKLEWNQMMVSKVSKNCYVILLFGFLGSF